MTYIEKIFGLNRKTAVVTGGATGIGRMIAEALVHAGARVLIASRKGEACAAVADELNNLGAAGSAEGFTGDVGTSDGVRALTTEIKSRTNSLHILINNAGKSWGAPYSEFPFKAWDKVMSVNCAGLFTLTRDMTPLLAKTASTKDPARIVNIGSVVGDIPIGDVAYSYAASKAAVHHMTRILGKELAGQRITVNALAPGPFVSRMTKHATGNSRGRKRVADDVPLGRLGEPSDIAGCILFLCGKGGAYTTGGIIPVSGGINVDFDHSILAGIRG